MHRSMVAALALLGLTAACAGAALAADADSASKATTPPAAGAMKAAAPAGAAHKATMGATMKPKTGTEVVVLETVLGDIVIKLADADAPKTAANFRKLVAEKFYDGTYFHRVFPGFMIQGGDPNSKNTDPSDDGTGGPTGPDGKPYTVPAEIRLKHLRGSVATARLGDEKNPKRESSGSQFFIDLAPQPTLDVGGYTVFGEVISGMDAVDKIAALGNDPSLPDAVNGGKNPQKKALIKRAYLAPLGKVTKTTSATTTTKTTTVTADTTKK